MKFELKTEKENYSKSFSYIFRTFSVLVLIIILSDVSLKLGIISRYYEIDYKCKLLSVEKSKFNFQRLSKLSNIKTKQGIWDFCRKVFK